MMLPLLTILFTLLAGEVLAGEMKPCGEGPFIPSEGCYLTGKDWFGEPKDDDSQAIYESHAKAIAKIRQGGLKGPGMFCETKEKDSCYPSTWQAWFQYLEGNGEPLARDRCLNKMQKAMEAREELLASGAGRLYAFRDTKLSINMPHEWHEAKQCWRK